VTRNNHLKSHAVSDLPSRIAKGKKIEWLLDLARFNQPIRILDVGTGSGGIANYFGVHKQLNCEVTSVDVIDERKIFDGYRFVRVAGIDLPFEDKSFDVVISNHVIEHVGTKKSQQKHLEEIVRVLKLDGRGYVAAPSRWMLIEPHYQLAFLSWLPHFLRDSYIRLMRKGTFYDCEPLSVCQLERMLNKVGVQYCHMHIESIKALIHTEASTPLIRCIAKQPDFLLNLLRRITPTLIYTFEIPMKSPSLK
jgi:ubiquinone/menaquinone biosynthesis C-methylase UbiE